MTVGDRMGWDDGGKWTCCSAQSARGIQRTRTLEIPSMQVPIRVNLGDEVHNVSI